MVWCLRKLQENIFGWFQTFVIFGLFSNFVHFFWPTITKITSNEKQSLILRLLKSNSSFPEVAYCPEWAKMIEMFNHGPKSLKIKNLAKIISSIFFKKPGNVFIHFICQTKSPILSDKWSKGFWNWSNYARDMGSQSCNTNLDSPCKYIMLDGCTKDNFIFWRQILEPQLNGRSLAGCMCAASS